MTACVTRSAETTQASTLCLLRSAWLPLRPRMTTRWRRFCNCGLRPSISWFSRPTRSRNSSRTIAFERFTEHLSPGGNCFMASVSTMRATLDDLYRTEGKAELIGGRVVHFMPSGFLPSRVAGNIFVSLHLHTRTVKQGEAFGDGMGYAVPEL